MHMRTKKWARPELQACPFFIDAIKGPDAQTGALLGDATSCSMCRRQIINAGLERVVIRRTPTEFEIVQVSDWVAEDDSLPELP